MTKTDKHLTLNRAFQHNNRTYSSVTKTPPPAQSMNSSTLKENNTDPSFDESHDKPSSEDSETIYFNKRLIDLEQKVDDLVVEKSDLINRCIASENRCLDSEKDISTLQEQLIKVMNDLKIETDKNESLRLKLESSNKQYIDLYTAKQLSDQRFQLDVKSIKDDIKSIQNNSSKIKPKEDSIYGNTNPDYENLIYDLPVSNRFLSLTPEEANMSCHDQGDESKFMLIGDTSCSMSNNYKNKFCAEWRKKKRQIYSKAKADIYVKNFKKLVKESAPDSSVVLHFGTEDFHQNKDLVTPRNVLMDKFKSIINSFKSIRENRSLSIAGILPRLNHVKGLNIGAFNKDLEKLCIQNNVQFIRTWKHFIKDNTVYMKNGVHLSNKGKSRLADILTGGAVRSFLLNHSKPEKTN